MLPACCPSSLQSLPDGPTLQVGLLAPWLLVLTRVVQGFAVGGEFTATIVFLVEHAPPGQAGLQGSWAFFSVMLGVLAGSLVSMLFNYALSDAQLYAWGWRVPFLLSILGAGVGAYMRRAVHEPPKDNHLNEHFDAQACSSSSSSDALEAKGLTKILPPVVGEPRCSDAAEGACLASLTLQQQQQLDMKPETQSVSSEDPKSSRGVAARAEAAFAALRCTARSPTGLACQGVLTVFLIDSLTAVGFYLVVIFLPVYFQVGGGGYPVRWVEVEDVQVSGVESSGLPVPHDGPGRLRCGNNGHQVYLYNRC